VEPNLVWEVIEHSPRKRRYHSAQRECISLFDISSVQKAAESINLNAFRHAVPEKSILITLNDDSVCLFEANDVSEAKKIIHGLRWIEARLTFNIIVGNVHVCSEMLSMSDQRGISELTSELMMEVTDQLVEKSRDK